MPVRDLHEKPFDAGTLTKLSIYRRYVQGWLMVFLQTRRFPGEPLQIYDLFCGPGRDLNGVSGSPLILLEELERNRTLIEAGNRSFRIVFNDADGEKTARLREICSAGSFRAKPQFESLEFGDAFAKFVNEFGVGPTLVFIDQNGVRHLSREVFKKITAKPKTDLMFFFASGFVHRFVTLAPEINYPRDTEHHNAHRVIAQAYREWAPEMFLAPFSIKKEGNIYGLVFASHHWRGIQKFLQAAWKEDGVTGEANFEIESDLQQGSLDFDTVKGSFKKRKSDVFEEELYNSIRSRGVLRTERDVFLTCLANGFLSGAAKPVYERLIKDGVIKNDRHNRPRTSDIVMKETPRTFRF